MTTAAETGARGEKAALDYLLSNGFTIRDRNWRHGHYELDIVAQKADTVHFVEVKCRRAGGLTTPEDAITYAKFSALKKAARAYIERYRLDSEIQFDLIAVEYSRDGSTALRYVPQAMQCSW